MSSNGKRNRGREPYLNGKHTAPQPGDERDGGWPRDRLIEMDRQFRERVERAFRDGTERRHSVASNGANPSTLRYT
jgi:hypothetical protein